MGGRGFPRNYNLCSVILILVYGLRDPVPDKIRAERDTYAPHTETEKSHRKPGAAICLETQIQTCWGSLQTCMSPPPQASMYSFLEDTASCGMGLYSFWGHKMLKTPPVLVVLGRLLQREVTARCGQSRKASRERKMLTL